MDRESHRPSTASSQDSLMTAGSPEASSVSNGDLSDNINVVVRVRPTNDIETRHKDSHALQYPGEGQILVDEEQTTQTKLFTFSVVFEPEATQEDVLEYCGVKRLCDAALDGFASTIMAYGQTGAGKTYTMTGTEAGKDNQPGLIQLSFAYLFNELKQRKETTYVVRASYLEIYKEHVLDLLNPSPKSLQVRWNKNKGHYAENLFVVECEDIGDLQGVLEEGRKNRQIRSHEMNEHSSRSHTILTVYLNSEQKDFDDPTSYIRKQGKLSFVDLAGSEKTKKTKSQGSTLKEANNINKSLLVLGNCISMLADPKKRNGHIPYRDSTLTKLLSDSLAGNGMALIIACVSPARSNTLETIQTLRYASRARRVKTKPMVRMDPRELTILSLRREVKLLRMENAYLRQQIKNNAGAVKLDKVVSTAVLPKTPDSGLEIDNSEDPIKDRQMVTKYMQENEELRAENAEIHRIREILIRDHEAVCRENERLQNKLRDLEIAATNGEGLSPAMFGSTPTPPLGTPASAGNGSWRTLHELAKQPLPNKNMDKELREIRDTLGSSDSGGSGRRSRQTSQERLLLSPTVTKIGRC
ncbi:kinesin-like protein KIF12 isoform X1 [Varroa destructor]|uniref:Kinesin-like protein n=1 Tax=Varroa destructor TaxID=109461 RepID=A0A7M7JCB8_VARDE|nr:kinesin-like protein KIF12 isoform X1 [Varroa destructor]